MTIFIFTGLLIIISFFAGLLGSLTGLGGGIIIIPVLVLLLHVDIHFAMGASLISVIATSSGTTAAYLRRGYTNLRIGMFLEVAAVIGAFLGALLLGVVSTAFLSILLSCILFFSAYFTIQRHEDDEVYENSHPWSVKLKLDGTYPHKNELKQYRVQHAPLAFVLMTFAGMISGLLGLGAGTLKVLAMDQAMRLPYKVSTTTSNFMIGITAAVSAGIYFSHGYINPVIVFPVLLGVIAGAFTGAKMLHTLPIRPLRIIFSLIITLMGIQMLYQVLVNHH